MSRPLLYSSGADAGSVQLTAAVRRHAPSGWQLRGPSGSVPVAFAPWPSPSPLAWFARVAVPNLAANSAFEFALVDGAGAVRARCRARTLPNQLPTDGSPLRVLLASCFSRGDDAGVGDALARLPSGSQPHFRIFCGDQVYLDGAWSIRLTPRSTSGLRKALLDDYWASFGQSPSGFGDYLQAGTNFFLSDDHEFFNNSPFPTSVSVNAITQSGADTWRKIATRLYRGFQGDYQGFSSFAVPPIAFGFLDTRIDRDQALDALCKPQDLAALRGWVTALNGPGVLVLGQPLLASPAADPTGRFGDASIQNYRQIAEIVSAIASARHTLVVVTGDVHFGRISLVTPPTGARLIEVISSPLAQIAFAKGTWKCPPTRIEGAAGTRFVGAESFAVPGWSDDKDHFAVLEFRRSGASARMAVSRWRIPHRDAAVQTIPGIPL